MTMDRSLCVAGCVNIETSVMIYDFPVVYDDSLFCPDNIFDGVGGAAANVAFGARRLLDGVSMCSVTGRDYFADEIFRKLDAAGIDSSYVVRDWKDSARTVILLDREGRRRPVCDFRGSAGYDYDEGRALEFLRKSRFLYSSTMPWARRICTLARKTGRKVFVDVHAIRFDDEYHRAFLHSADVVFFSVEKLAVPFDDFIRKLWYDYDIGLVVVTDGANGAGICVRSEGVMRWYRAIRTRPVVDTVGAGDSFAAGFVSSYISGESSDDCLFAGQLCASYKIGARGHEFDFPGTEKLCGLKAAYGALRMLADERKI